MELQVPKGMRDFPPEEKILRDKVMNALIEVFERYGFNPLETPIIERLDVLTAKCGDAVDETDVMKEVYTFKDQGERDLGLRFELTLSTARFVGMNPQLRMPFKRYQIGDVFRDGPIKLGRYREFTQCDVDIFGCATMAADAEIIQLLIDGFAALMLDVTIQVNNRKLLNGLLLEAGVPENKTESAIITIDKLEKQGVDDIRKELEQKGLADDVITKALGFFQVSGTNEEKINTIASFIQDRPEDGLARQGLSELKEVLALVQSDNVLFNPSLARGLAYYTGTVFEGFVNDGKVTSSVCGGGRYDEMVGKLLGTDKQVPAVGVAFGLEPITEELKLRQKEVQKTVTQLFVIPIKCEREAAPLIKKLRDAGLKVEADLMGRSISKNLDYANAMGIPFVIIIGPKELEEGKIKLRDMKTGDENLMTVEDVSSKVSTR